MAEAPTDYLSLAELPNKTDLPYNAHAYVVSGEDARASLAALNDSMKARFSPFLRRCADKAHSIAQDTAGARMTLLFLGDSVAESLIPGDIRKALYRAWGFAGVWMGATSDLAFFAPTLVGGAATSNSNYAMWPTGDVFSVPSGGSVALELRTITGGETPDWTLPNELRKLDTYKVCYITESGGGAFKIQTRAYGGDWVDSADHLSISASGATGLAVATVGVALDYGTAIRVVGTSGTVRIAGVLALNSTGKGVVQVRLNAGGLDMSNSNTVNSDILASALAVLQPDLITCAFKDEGVGAKLAAQQTLWDTAYPTDWAFLGEYPDSTGDDGGTDARNSEIREHARSRGWYYFDTKPIYGTYALANARGWYADVTHTNDRGGSVGAGLLWREMGLLDNFQAASSRSVHAPSIRADSELIVAGHDVKEWILKAAQSQWLRRGGMVFQDLTEAKISSGQVLTPTSNTTVAVWVRIPASAIESTLFSMRASSSNNSLEVRLRSSDGFVIAYKDAGGVDTANVTNGVTPYASAAGSLALVLLTKDSAGVLGLYWDGERISADTLTPIAATTALSDTQLIVGAGVNATRGGLEVFSASKWSRVLTLNEIKAFYETGIPATSGLQLWWPLNEGRGGIAYDARGVHHGAVISPAAWLRADHSLLSATATLDFPSIAAAGTADLPVTVTGAAVGDTVTVNKADGTLPNPGIMLYAQVTAADTVTVRAMNITAGAIDPASASYRVTVNKA